MIYGHLKCDFFAQTVVSVLADCGDNIEAAIKRLGEMQLQEDVKVEQATTSGKSCCQLHYKICCCECGSCRILQASRLLL
jgi:hypothetical protein